MRLTKQNYKEILEEYDKIRKEYAESDKVSSASNVIELLRKTSNDGKAKEIDAGYSYRKNRYDSLESAKLENEAEVNRFIIRLEEDNKNIDNEIARVKEEISRLEKDIEKYKDSEKENEKIVRVLREWLANDYSTKADKRKIEIGGTIQFGRYPQNWDGKDQTPIEWIVLNIEGNRALVTSKYALDCKKYNMSRTGVTWETCSLRQWLNSTFLSSAFTAKEQAQIRETIVSADRNPKHSTNPGNATRDKVFMLSISEAKKYFTTDESRRCAPTAYAKAQGAWTSDEYKTKATCWWWLRSHGGSQFSAAYVVRDGSVNYYGSDVDYDIDAVRPVLWINLDS